ncbi:hypothetical protein BOTBODRAFT_167077 [Botryobasidium botryosum FD-172 SS1]|uniref:Acid phosphatase n=1 Tax=Botryobasidium botryosum (strain FD-172 SS1) TaxID=930990 RepID=A0A067M705_BOTB1|nr:hypothetical protein BOTBODRAFT_167077 [Botryobasidium botryosum FD-172 SS1]
MWMQLALLAFNSPASVLPGTTGIYNSSVTPPSLPWNTYNYCNAPHLNAEHYHRPNVADAKLVHVTIMTRHHKRTPDNLLPNENAYNPAEGWDCSNFIQNNYADRTAHIYHETNAPSWHPFLNRIWNGTCDSGQLTAGGIEDAIKHGKDLWSVYGTKLNFLKSVDTKDIYIRTSNSDRTYQVSGGMLYGMDPGSAQTSFPVHTQPSNIDSLVPSYSCPAAEDIRSSYQSVSAWTDHLSQHTDLKARLDAILGTAGLNAWSSWYDHFFDIFTSRTCGGHSLPCNTITGACVSEADAAQVFAIGDFEYNYIWNAASGADDYVKLTFGVMFLELAQNLHALARGNEPYKLRLYVGHDGSMIRLASGLGIGAQTPLRWPALGSEIAMEVWEAGSGRFVRVLHEGTPVAGLEMVAYDKFIQLLESNVPADLAQRCNGT